jgi:hypothetical protein
VVSSSVGLKVLAGSIGRLKVQRPEVGAGQEAHLLLRGEDV